MVNDEEDREEEARRMTVDAVREFGGFVEQLGEAFDRVWKTTASVEDDDLSYFVGFWSRRLWIIKSFCSLPWCSIVEHSSPIYIQNAVLSLPPSPTLTTRTVKYAQMLLELGKALGNRVFEDNITGVEGEGEVDIEGASRVLGLEDARDRVVDMPVIVDAERGVSTPDPPL